MMYSIQPYGPIQPLNNQPAPQTPAAAPMNAPNKENLMNAYAQHLLNQNTFGQHFKMGMDLYNSMFAPHQQMASAMQTSHGMLGSDGSDQGGGMSQAMPMSPGMANNAAGVGSALFGSRHGAAPQLGAALLNHYAAGGK